jgi:hypothetical protein
MDESIQYLACDDDQVAHLCEMRKLAASKLERAAAITTATKWNYYFLKLTAEVLLRAGPL